MVEGVRGMVGLGPRMQPSFVEAQVTAASAAEVAGQANMAAFVAVGEVAEVEATARRSFSRDAARCDAASHEL